MLARPEGIAPVLRSGARAGDALCVTGALGGAWRSGRQLAFIPRVREARVLAARYGLHAMIDLSDGLAGDLGHLCRASGVGAEVRADLVPIHDGCLRPARARPVRPAARANEQALQAALTDGEDYELLFTLPAEPGRSPAARSAAGHARDADRPDRRRVRTGADRRLRPADPLSAGGWEHAT